MTKSHCYKLRPKPFKEKLIREDREGRERPWRLAPAYSDRKDYYLIGYKSLMYQQEVFHGIIDPLQAESL